MRKKGGYRSSVLATLWTERLHRRETIDLEPICRPWSIAWRVGSNVDALLLVIVVVDGVMVVFKWVLVFGFFGEELLL